MVKRKRSPDADHVEGLILYLFDYEYLIRGSFYKTLQTEYVLQQSQIADLSVGEPPVMKPEALL
jgi:hypothetical protein